MEVLGQFVWHGSAKFYLVVRKCTVKNMTLAGTLSRGSALLCFGNISFYFLYDHPLLFPAGVSLILRLFTSASEKNPEVHCSLEETNRRLK